MLHAKYIIYLTRTLSSLNKKNCLLFVFPLSLKNPCNVDQIFSAGYAGCIWKFVVIFAQMNPD